MSSNLLLKFFFGHKKRLIISFLLSCILTLLFYTILSTKKKITYLIFFELNHTYYNHLMDYNTTEIFNSRISSLRFLEYYYLKTENKLFNNLYLDLKTNEKKIMKQLNSIDTNLKVSNLIINKKINDNSIVPNIILSFSDVSFFSNKNLEHRNLEKDVKKIFENNSFVNGKKYIDVKIFLSDGIFKIYYYQIFSIIIFLFFVINFILNRNTAKKYFKF
jgi:hypothetical protein